MHSFIKSTFLSRLCRFKFISDNFAILQFSHFLFILLNTGKSKFAEAKETDSGVADLMLVPNKE